MKQTILFFLILTMIGCRTSSRIVEKSKTAESISLDLQTTEKEVATVDFDWEKYLADLNFKFDGLTNDDTAELEFIKTQDGIKIKAKGKGEITTAVKQESESVKQEDTKETESVIKADYKQTKQTKQVEKETKTTDFSIWIYIVFLLFICFILVLWWFFGRPKELKK